MFRDYSHHHHPHHDEQFHAGEGDPRWEEQGGSWPGFHCGGRGDRHGGGHGFRHFGFGGGGPRGFGFRSGRKLSSGDLQLVILALLGEKPRHGYDLIKAVEERSRGFYSPSPGVIYPALTYLEEAGDAVPESEGTRKLYRLTDAGKAHLEERRAEATALLEQLAEMGRGMDRLRDAFEEGEGEGEGPFRHGGRAAAPELAVAFRLLRSAMAHVRGAPREELLRVAEILRRAAEEILGRSGGGEV